MKNPKILEEELPTMNLFEIVKASLSLPEAAVLAKPRHPMIKAFRDDERYCRRVLCDYLHLLEDWKVQHAPDMMDEEPDDRFVEACEKFDYIEYLAIY